MVSRFTPWAASLSLLLVIAVGGAAHAAVAGQAGPYTVHFETQPAVPSVGANQVRLHVMDAAGMPVKGAHVTVTPEMPGMAMDSSSTVASEDGNGIYSAPADFGMAGQWHVKVTVQGSAGSGETQFSVIAGQAGGILGHGLPWTPIAGSVLALAGVGAAILVRRRAA